MFDKCGDGLDFYSKQSIFFLFWAKQSLDYIAVVDKNDKITKTVEGFEVYEEQVSEKIVQGFQSER